MKLNPAPLSRRALAVVIDIAAAAMVAALLALAPDIPALHEAGWPAPASPYIPLIVYFGISGLLALFIWLFGGTPGQNLAGIEVVNGRNALRPNFALALLRALFIPISWLPLGAGIARIQFARDHRSYHGLLSRTVAIQTNEHELPLHRLARQL